MKLNCAEENLIHGSCEKLGHPAITQLIHRYKKTTKQ